MENKKIWELYEEAVAKELQLRKKSENEENILSLIESVTQNGISVGILRCLEELEGDKSKTWQKSFRIYCKVQGIDLDTGFGFWVPVKERLPEKGTYVIACFEDGFITGVEYEEDGGWALWQDSGEVIAWMPLPKPYKEETNNVKTR